MSAPVATQVRKFCGHRYRRDCIECREVAAERKRRQRDRLRPQPTPASAPPERRYRVETRDLGYGIVEQRLYGGRVLVEKRRVEPSGATPVSRPFRNRGHRGAKDGSL